MIDSDLVRIRFGSVQGSGGLGTGESERDRARALQKRWSFAREAMAIAAEDKAR
jgi:hypothetical protein